MSQVVEFKDGSRLEVVWGSGEARKRLLEEGEKRGLVVVPQAESLGAFMLGPYLRGRMKDGRHVVVVADHNLPVRFTVCKTYGEPIGQTCDFGELVRWMDDYLAESGHDEPDPDAPVEIGGRWGCFENSAWSWGEFKERHHVEAEPYYGSSATVVPLQYEWAERAWAEGATPLPPADQIAEAPDPGRIEELRDRLWYASGKSRWCDQHGEAGLPWASYELRPGGYRVSPQEYDRRWLRVKPGAQVYFGSSIREVDDPTPLAPGERALYEDGLFVKAGIHEMPARGGAAA